jgi:hypothetical protein
MRTLCLSFLLLGCTPPADTGPTDSGPHDTGSEDTGPDDTGPDDTGEPPACVPDGDGRVSFEEFLADPALGIVATYSTNEAGTTVPVSGLAGLDQGDGSRAWDFSSVNPGTDTTWDVRLQAPGGTWFAGYFPTATYYVGLDSSERILGAYRLDPDVEQLQLLGMATAEEAEGGVLIYERPVVVFDFPLALGQTWEADAVQADGHWEGEDYPADFGWAGVVTLEHSYAFEVDAHGRLAVPLGDFDVLRLRLDQRMEAVNSISGVFGSEAFIAYFYVAECAGLVARVRSVEGEREADFTEASEYLRLGF